MKQRTSLTLRLLAGAFAATLAADPLVFAQSQPAKTTEEVSAALASSKPQGAGFTQQDYDELLAPIALYPDSLLAQVLMAATYPLEVVEAARWQKANSTLKDKALEDALA